MGKVFKSEFYLNRTYFAILPVNIGNMQFSACGRSWILLRSKTISIGVVVYLIVVISMKLFSKVYGKSCVDGILIRNIQGESLARGPKLLSMYTVEQRGFLDRKYWQTGSFKACQTGFRTEFDERRAPSNCCIQKLVKKLETRGSRSNACRLLSLGPNEGQSVQKYTPHNRTTQRRYTPRYSSRQRRHFGKSNPEFGETHSSVFGCESRPVSASIMSRSCFASFPLCVYKFSSHYLNNIIFYRQ